MTRKTNIIGEYEEKSFYQDDYPEMPPMDIVAYN